jgi:hypothetical protein
MVHNMNTSKLIKDAKGLYNLMLINGLEFQDLLLYLNICTELANRGYNRYEQDYGLQFKHNYKDRF